MANFLCCNRTVKPEWQSQQKPTQSTQIQLDYGMHAIFKLRHQFCVRLSKQETPELIMPITACWRSGAHAAPSPCCDCISRNDTLISGSWMCNTIVGSDISEEFNRWRGVVASKWHWNNLRVVIATQYVYGFLVNPLLALATKVSAIKLSYACGSTRMHYTSPASRSSLVQPVHDDRALLFCVYPHGRRPRLRHGDGYCFDVSVNASVTLSVSKCIYSYALRQC